VLGSGFDRIDSSASAIYPSPDFLIVDNHLLFEWAAAAGSPHPFDSLDSPHQRLQAAAEVAHLPSLQVVVKILLHFQFCIQLKKYLYSAVASFASE
jgi:hypothetical protein